jgi:hypothetical protein
MNDQEKVLIVPELENMTQGAIRKLNTKGCLQSRKIENVKAADQGEMESECKLSRK